MVVSRCQKHRIIRSNLSTNIGIVEDLDAAFESVERFDFFVMINQIEGSFTSIHTDKSEGCGGGGV